MRAIDRRPAEEDKDRITGVVRSNLQRRISTPMSLRTYKTVSDTERLSARMTKASYINLTEGTHAAQLYTNQHIPGYRLDTQLTDEHGAVFYNRTTNDLRVAYRGTQTNFDWTTNLRMASMMENNSSQMPPRPWPPPCRCRGPISATHTPLRARRRFRRPFSN